jgi:methylglutaconyl-CoA hydratase
MSCVDTHVERGVFTITLNDVDNRNALSDALKTELASAIDRAESDAQVRVVVLTNAGKTFCAGADLKQKAAPQHGQPAVSMADLFTRIRRSSKPFVGRIAGHCVAGGVGLAAAMDISVAADDAGFGFTEVRIGVSPAIISVVCLPKMRAADAREAFLRGNRFDAARAKAMGLINQVVPRHALDSAVEAVVRDLIAGAPGALAATKSVIEQVPTMHFEDALSWCTELSSALFANAEGKEGITAYKERRNAAWNLNND